MKTVGCRKGYLRSDAEISKLAMKYGRTVKTAQKGGSLDESHVGLGYFTGYERAMKDVLRHFNAPDPA